MSNAETNLFIATSRLHKYPFNRGSIDLFIIIIRNKKEVDDQKEVWIPTHL